MGASTPIASDPAFGALEWVEDAVFYQIFPDRFAMSPLVPKPSNLEAWNSAPTVNGFKGGDLLGVRDHLDYLQDLGITAIYFTPVFQSTANHRYHTHDYYVVDPILGGNPALRALLDEAHRRGMRVVLDGVLNHASRSFYQFSSILENGPQSPYIDWFTIYSWPLHPYGPEPSGYAAWWDKPALPKFNTGTPAVRQFLWDVGRYWIENGIDGWRLDVPSEINDDDFWREFRRRVKSANPDAYLVGEIWGDARRWLQGDQFDAVMNYLLTRACIGFFAGLGAGIDHEMIGGTGLDGIASLNAEGFSSAIESLLALYPWSATLSQLNLLGSHDTARFLSIARQDRSALCLAMLFQMTYPGAPCIYYGDEIGMLGGPDPLNRAAFIWQEELWDEELRRYIRETISLRHANPVLRRGSYRTLLAHDGTYVFARELDRDVAIVALNAGHDPVTIDLALPHELADLEISSVWHGGHVRIERGSIDAWLLPSRSGAVLIGRTSGPGGS